MSRPFEFSSVTEDYLTSYRAILEEMIQSMSRAELTDGIGYNFIVQMIPHHRAAIKMSQNLLRYTTCISIQEIAQGIIQEQSRSIADMERILPGCKRVSNTPEELANNQRRVERIMLDMFSEMGRAPQSNDINADFMWEMIPHHCGAIEISRSVLRFTLCPGLEQILDNIITSQERGVCQMRCLLRRMNLYQP